MIRPAREMSFVPMETPAAAAKLRTIGSNETDAIWGASSTFVKIISDVVLSAINLASFLLCGCFRGSTDVCPMAELVTNNYV